MSKYNHFSTSISIEGFFNELFLLEAEVYPLAVAGYKACWE